MKLLVAALLVVAAAPALAQGGPSFDCARASTEVERTVCKNPRLSIEDRQMAGIYEALRDRLSGAARVHLEKDQASWLARRGVPCTHELADCLKTLYGLRRDRLEVLGAGPYPFVSEQAVARTGKVGNTAFVIDITYPQFDGAADFSAVNRQLADAASKAAAAAVPAGNNDGLTAWDFGQDFVLYRPGPHAITALIRQLVFAGGAHPNSSAHAVLVDLRAGRAVAPQDVFSPGVEGLRVVADIVRDDLTQQFKDRPGYDDALEPANLAKLLADRKRWLFLTDFLKLNFDRYEIAS